MPTKRKAKPKTKRPRKKKLSKDDALKLKMSRLELFGDMMEIQRDQQTVAGLKEKLQKMQVESILINRRIPEIEDTLQPRVNTFNNRLAKLRKALGVKDGEELDLRTGDVIQPNVAKTPPPPSPPKDEGEDEESSE